MTANTGSEASSTGPRVAVVVLGAGNGTRLGRSEPKAFVHIAGRSTISRALESVFAMREPAQVIVTVPQSFASIARELVRHVDGWSEERTTITVGGGTRQASVAAALKHLDDSVEVVLVHDAARPLTPTVVFDSVVAEVLESGAGAVPGLPVADTIKRLDDADAVVETLDRQELVAVQTPQGFPREHLLHAHAHADGEYTDDSALVAAAGFPVHVVAGDQMALKITTAWDLRRAEALLAEPAAVSIRVGTGTDVHAYDAERPLWLAGLYWPDEPGLAGHSDGDVVCHAICDAMLSAAKLGDIGEVFGTGDPQFENAHGEVFLRAAMRELAAVGLEVGNVSVQVVGNRPKLSGRRREAEAHLSTVLGATVSIAATTTDALGFTGRGEGVAAVATALVHSISTETRPLRIIA